MKEKGFIPIPLLIIVIVSIITASGVGYGAIEYNKTSKLVKEAEQLTKEEKYNEANEKLEVAQNKFLVKNLGIKKQEISNGIEENKKLEEDKSKYNQGLDELNTGNLEKTIELLSELPEDSFYYQKAQTKIEETKRKIVEGELGETKMAKEEAEQKTEEEKIGKEAAEAKAKQEEIQRKLKEGELSAKAAEELKMNTDNDGDGLTYRRELELGISDSNTDSDGDGIIDSKDTHPAGGGRNMPQTFAWNYGNIDWTWTETIQEDWYDYYKSKPRVSVTNVEYVTADDPFIKKISEVISKGAKEKGVDKVRLAISFVQSLPYVKDAYTGYDEYPKYPVETFFEKNGDCEDTTYLTASILVAMNMDTVLIDLPGHMAVGIWMECNAPGTSYKLGDKCYYYIETTGENWTVGEIPDDYKYSKATIIKLSSGEAIDNTSLQYVKPCSRSSGFPKYYSDGKNFYFDNQCNNIAYCLSYQEFYYNLQTENLYWDSSCNQIVTIGCYKSTLYPAYFFNGVNWYYDSQCTHKSIHY